MQGKLQYKSTNIPHIPTVFRTLNSWEQMWKLDLKCVLQEITLPGYYYPFPLYFSALKNEHESTEIGGSHFFHSAVPIETNFLGSLSKNVNFQHWMSLFISFTCEVINYSFCNVEIGWEVDQAVFQSICSYAIINCSIYDTFSQINWALFLSLF